MDDATSPAGDVAEKGSSIDIEKELFGVPRTKAWEDLPDTRSLTAI